MKKGNMKIKEMTNQHIENGIKYFENKLKEMPIPQTYVGDSDYAESAVKQENRHNDELAEKIGNHIKALKRELKNRLLNPNPQEI